MKNIRCPCENCVALTVCERRAEEDSSIKVFRKYTKCKNLTVYLDRCKVSTKYSRLHRTEKVLGIDK